MCQIQQPGQWPELPTGWQCVPAASGLLYNRDVSTHYQKLSVTVNQRTVATSVRWYFLTELLHRLHSLVHVSVSWATIQNWLFLEPGAGWWSCSMGGPGADILILIIWLQQSFSLSLLLSVRTLPPLCPCGLPFILNVCLSVFCLQDGDFCSFFPEQREINNVSKYNPS